ncbi:MAG: tetratricopeptide repeat protein [Polyangiaceae bacterium]|jgi:tetratricopeptide (TPR) repeat protein
MPSRTRRLSDRIVRPVASLLLSVGSLEARATSSADELVRQAQAHELANEPDTAARRYTEALSIDPSDASAWLGLAALRLKLDDAGEAERVYTAALEHVPTLAQALAGRARARWQLGRHRAAEIDMDRYAAATDDATATRELSEWYAYDGRLPAQLALWRRMLATAMERADGRGAREARTMVLALSVLVDGADPATAPADPDSTRLALAAIARRAFANPRPP